MTPQQEMNMNFEDKPRVFVKNGAVMASSLTVARNFGKLHKHVLRDIRLLIEKTGEWGRSNFGHTPFVDSQNGQTYSSYDMTSKGFHVLVMGFTGDEALIWKIRYADAFEMMVNALNERALTDSSEEVTRITHEAEAAVAEMDADWLRYREQYQAVVHETWDKERAREDDRILVKAAQLQITNMARRLNIPTEFRWSSHCRGGMLSELYIFCFFAVGESKNDATLLWLLITGHDQCLSRHLYPVRMTAADLLTESEGRLVSVAAIYRSRKHLMALGFLEETPPSLWRINASHLYEKLNEIRVTAFLKNHSKPWLRAEEGGESWVLQELHDKLQAIIIPEPGVDRLAKAQVAAPTAPAGQVALPAP
jgi:Rha family phage regulatory protein